jgi:hypothetical protein
LLFAAFLRLGLTLSSARNWALLCGLGSMLWPYAGSSFDLAPQAFFLTLAVLAGADALLFESRSLGVVSGLSLLALATIQETYLPLGAAVLLAVRQPSWRAVLGNLRRPALVWVAAGACLGLLAVLAYNFGRFGDPFRTGRETVAHPILGNPLLGLAGLLFSPAKSLFLYSPLHLLGLIGLIKLVRKEPGWALPALATFLMHLLLVASLACWAGEWAWGPRYLLATAPLVLMAVQLLSLCVDHQIYYIEKRFRPFFWVDNRFMYTDSPLLQRPREIWDLLHAPDYHPGMKLVPGPFDVELAPVAEDAPAWVVARARRQLLPRVVTSAIGRPLRKLIQGRTDWQDDYYVLNAPRPWPLWSAGLPAELRPVPLLPWAMLGVFALGLSAWRLRRCSSPSAQGSVSSQLQAS